MHDFNKFPELTNNNMDQHYWDSPHKQITDNFDAVVVKVTDGDTVRLRADFRDFDFPMRILYINAPEMNEPGGREAKDHLKNLVEGEEVRIIIQPLNRVEKWGRLLGDIQLEGMRMSQEMLIQGHAVEFDRRDEGKIPSLGELIAVG